MTEWYFDSYSEEYGTERFGAYDTHEEAQEGITRVQLAASLCRDGIQRTYTAPYERTTEETK